MIYLYLFAIIMAGALVYHLWACLGTPKKTNEKRHEVIKQSIGSIGGTIIQIEVKKRSEFPDSDQFNQDDGSYHVFYKLKYQLEDQLKEGWAILKLQQSMVGPVGASEEEWYWKL